jgi:hypothetical protein
LPTLGGGGEDFMIDRTYIKKYPAEYHSQSAIDAAYEIIDQHGGTFKSDEMRPGNRSDRKAAVNGERAPRRDSC